ncbi:hypothetical protein MKW94_030597, partial [Papaver nudicaule]|nr:hypothetical protein [Papaver nudicaule]
DRYWIKDCILTSPPCMNTSISSDSNSKSSIGHKNSMVYILFDGGHIGYNDYLLLFCHPGGKEWKRHPLNASEEPKKMFFLKNKLHVMCAKFVCLELEVQGGSGIDADETLAVDHFLVSTERIVVYGAAGGCVSGYKEVYLESFGEVFRIHKWYILR